MEYLNSLEVIEAINLAARSLGGIAEAVMDDVMKLRREAEDEAGEDLVGAIAVVPRDVLLEGDVVELVGVAVNRAGRARPIVLDLERGTAVVLDESDHFVDASAIVRELRAL